jgi:hypothetical protein
MIMKISRIRIILQGIILIALLGSISAPLQSNKSGDEWFSTPEGLITEIYKSVTAKAGEMPDWEKVRSMFIDEAVIVLRTSRFGTTVFDVQGFINDFETFYKRPGVGESGFEEKILRMKKMVFGDTANIVTVYSAHITGSPRPPQQGVDQWLLVKKNNQWKIAAVINEVVDSTRPIPDDPEWKF